MDVPWQQLQPETLRALAEEFVTREGTDYGLRELSHESKVQDVLRAIQSGKVKVVFDPDTETCDLREVI